MRGWRCDPSVTDIRRVLPFSVSVTVKSVAACSAALVASSLTAERTSSTISVRRHSDSVADANRRAAPTLAGEAEKVRVADCTNAC
jgi:hypothetical protein